MQYPISLKIELLRANGLNPLLAFEEEKKEEFKMPEPLEEIKNRILQIEDLIPWRQNEFPKFKKEIEALQKEAHELRQRLNELTAKSEKKPEAETAKPAPEKTNDESDEGGSNGFWSL